MYRNVMMAAMLLPVSITALAGDGSNGRVEGAGAFSVGTRNTISFFSDDAALGKGIGGQLRYQFSDRISSEFFSDYISSQTGFSHREDYHIGWSLMYYFSKSIHFNHFLQPYLLAGHCFDYSVVSETGNRANSASRFTGATQVGVGTHLNFTKAFDCSLSAQYMLHFGREISATQDEGVVTIRRSDSVVPDGHFLVTISFNYKIANLRRHKA